MSITNQFIKRIVSGSAVVVVLLAVAILGGTGAGGAESQPEDVTSISREHPAIKGEFLTKMDRSGVQDTFLNFAERAEKLSYDSQHLLAHIFGEALYEGGGLEDFVICDSRFGFGCQHGFFGKAIEENGPEVIKQLEGACIETFGTRGTGCTHGIGHGILSYFGYEALEQALDSCAELAWKGELAGCSSGAFMEYNFRTMAQAKQERVGTRTLVHEERYEPCNILRVYRQSCYFEQPQWWRSSLEQSGVEDEETYRIAGLWCKDVPDPLERRACFLGIGNIVPSGAQYDVDLSVERCDLMPNAEAISYCRKGAAWGFFAEPSRRQQAISMCSVGAAPEERQSCLADYQII